MCVSVAVLPRRGAMFKVMAEGDLTQRINIFRNDEVGELGKTLNIFIEQLGETIKKITENAIKIEKENVELGAQVYNISRTIHNLSELMDDSVVI